MLSFFLETVPGPLFNKEVLSIPAQRSLFHQLAAKIKLFALGGPCSTMDNVVALHPAAPGSNLGHVTFSLLLSSWTVLISNPFSARGKGFRKCSVAKA